LPPGLGTFEHVDCLSVLEHSKRPWLLAANLERLMRPGATIYITVPFIFRKIHAYPDDYYRFTPAAVEHPLPDDQAGAACAGHWAIEEEGGQDADEQAAERGENDALVPEDRDDGLRGEGVNVLVTGRGTSGSWKIRGEQLGRAIGGRRHPDGDRRRALRRRRPRQARARRSGQPHPRRRSRPGLGHRRRLAAAGGQPLGPRRVPVLAARPDQAPSARRRSSRRPAAMADDVAEVCGTSLPVRAIPHHGRPGLKRTEIRERIGVVAYEGRGRHLGVWRSGSSGSAGCAARIDLLLNPASLNDADVVVALREADGYAARNWKSNVKLANAQGTGTPDHLRAGVAATSRPPAPPSRSGSRPRTCCRRSTTWLHVKPGRPTRTGSTPTGSSSPRWRALPRIPGGGMLPGAELLIDPPLISRAAAGWRRLRSQSSPPR
jgi:hypothetical protein